MKTSKMFASDLVTELEDVIDRPVILFDGRALEQVLSFRIRNPGAIILDKILFTGYVLVDYVGPLCVKTSWKGRLSIEYFKDRQSMERLEVPVATAAKAGKIHTQKYDHGYSVRQGFFYRKGEVR